MDPSNEAAHALRDRNGAAGKRTGGGRVAAQRIAGWAVALAVLGVFALIVVRCAWVCDDAYIIFRTADNLVHGRGAVWNVHERVQAYTCPLWMLLFSAVYSVTHQAFYTGILAGMVLSLLAVGILLVRVRNDMPAVLFVGAACVASKALVDYSTSGMENPLSHLLIVVFLILFVRSSASGQVGMGRWLALCLTAAAAAVNRMDTILLFLPALAILWWQRPARIRAALIALAGFAPLAAWLLFALFYYGFPWPNTAYAKLNNGIPAGLLAAQGFRYFAASLRMDPVTLPVIAAAILCAAWRRRFDTVAIAAGVLLYLAYLVTIGGDFMCGRFFTTPLLASIFLIYLVWRQLRPAWKVVAILFPLAGGLWFPQYSPLLSDRSYGAQNAENDHLSCFGVSDERFRYYPTCGLLRASFYPSMPADFLVKWGREDAKTAGTRPVGVAACDGFVGFYGGPAMTYIDCFGLTDPLLARLPPMYDPNWRIGHFIRAIPAGYEATLLDGENKIRDPALARYYDKLKLITAGPLISGQRFCEILKINAGAYSGLIDRDHYSRPWYPGGQALPYVPPPGFRPLPPRDGKAVEGPRPSLKFDCNGEVISPK
jgi:arabinofuranosyltransferase